MKRFIAACLLIAAGATPAAQISTQWAAVQALQSGTPVLIQFPNGQRNNGLVERVTDDDITIRRKAGVAVLQRRDVASVSIREPAARNNHAGIRNGALIGAAIGIGFAVLVTAHQENGDRVGTATPFVLGAAAAGALFGAGTKPTQSYRDRLIYVRQ